MPHLWNVNVLPIWVISSRAEKSVHKGRLYECQPHTVADSVSALTASCSQIRQKQTHKCGSALLCTMKRVGHKGRLSVWYTFCFCLKLNKAHLKECAVQKEGSVLPGSRECALLRKCCYLKWRWTPGMPTFLGCFSFRVSDADQCLCRGSSARHWQRQQRCHKKYVVT